MIALLCLLLLTPLVGAAQTPELPLGSRLPMADSPFLKVGGAKVPLGSLAGEKGTVLVFWSNQCPWVDKYQDRITALAGQFKGQGVQFILLNANDASSFPKETVAESSQVLEGLGSDVVYLIDEGSLLAQAVGASRTPHVYAFDGDLALSYLGTIDDSPGDPGGVKNPYLLQALTSVLAGQAPAVPKTKAFGCMIKFKK